MLFEKKFKNIEKDVVVYTVELEKLQLQGI